MSSTTTAAPGSKGRVLLAYSGGLDTSCILAWLIDEGYEVIAFMADVGQEEDFEAARVKADKIGAKKFVLADCRKEFVEHLIYPSVQANCIYEVRPSPSSSLILAPLPAHEFTALTRTQGVYLLGTSLARPVIARAMMDVVVEEDCQFVSHGCTGKGNDQVRFELAFYALQPDIKVIAPWRDPVFYERFAGRQALLDFAADKGIPVFQTAAKPWSTDENLFHISYEAGILEDPDTTPPADMWKLINGLDKCPTTPERISITFKKGIPVSLLIHPDGTEAVPSTEGKTVTDPVDIFLTLNALARKHGIGRIDIVENRFIGVKSRGCYESPGATILRKAHMDLEGLVVDRNVRALRDGFVTTELSKILYNGASLLSCVSSRVGRSESLTDLAPALPPSPSPSLAPLPSPTPSSRPRLPSPPPRLLVLARARVCPVVPRQVARDGQRPSPTRPHPRQRHRRGSHVRDRSPVRRRAGLDGLGHQL